VINEEQRALVKRLLYEEISLRGICRTIRCVHSLAHGLHGCLLFSGTYLFAYIPKNSFFSQKVKILQFNS